MAAKMAVICSILAVLVLLPGAPAFRTQSTLIQPPAQNNDKFAPSRHVMHRAFANAGRAPGLEIWRIENFEPVVYPKNNYGKFYTGDSFIVLNTIERKDKKLSWDIHFWLGSETSTDEAGAAAIYAVQLDDLLNGAPVQHREVQDHESQLFLSYFRNGVRYEQGGVGTGFRHVTTNAAGEKRLFQVKGKRNVRVRQVNLSVSSMNKGDCFILDAGNEILVYVGPQAKRVEKLKAISAANQIRDQDHNGRARVEITDEFSSDVDKQHFFDILGSGAPNQVPDEAAEQEDGAFETADANSVTLYKVSDARGGLKIDPISVKPLRQEMLDTNDCFILDTGSGIYVWVGRRSTPKEKTDALSKAQEFLSTKKYPAWTQVHRVVEGAESAPFKQYFATWRDVGMAHTRLVRSAMGYDSDDAELSELTDVEELKKSGGSAIGFMPDNGQNDIVETVQYVSNHGRGDALRNVVPLTPNMPLLGFGAYVITYKYNNIKGESGFIVYVWEGVKATQSVKERAFEDALALALERDAILVRTTQNNEPRHFLKLFKGKLVTSYTPIPIHPQLYRIRGTDASDVHANEVLADSSSLASNDVFALTSMEQRKVYIWVGLAASKFEKDMAIERFSGYWSDAVVEVIEEGAEPDNFWELLHGEGIYDRSMSEATKPLLEPRLFHCRLNGEQLQVEEIPQFEQADLDTNDVMLLDAGDEIYMWVGTGATAEENGRILELAKKYLKDEPTERTIDTTTVIRIEQSNEPRAFTRMFPTWEANYWQATPSYEDFRKQVVESNDIFESNEL
ncbi:gelsolin isoform X1 [Zeugodacus cucurbitae]|uniref:gelsolin isoform X1 n=2 Tax=Zeugodacus cucurbitae TaxID=28588 RepID=UPI000596A100|nr:gelsolin isoform X1 [Zeugodacus cucurbitae]